MVGLAGLAKKLGFASGDIRALPTFRATIGLDWNFQYPCSGKCLTTPKFKLTKVGMCLGQMFGDSLKGIADVVNDKIIGLSCIPFLGSFM